MGLRNQKPLLHRKYELERTDNDEQNGGNLFRREINYEEFIFLAEHNIDPQTLSWNGIENLVEIQALDVKIQKRVCTKICKMNIFLVNLNILMLFFLCLLRYSADLKNVEDSNFSQNFLVDFMQFVLKDLEIFLFHVKGYLYSLFMFMLDIDVFLNYLRTQFLPLRSIYIES